MDTHDLKKTVVSSLVEVAPNVDPSTLDPASTFRDQFDFDSIDHLNFVLALEKALGIKIPELEYPQLAGLNAALDYLSTRS
jgi:acyl carrier protein